MIMTGLKLYLGYVLGVFTVAVSLASVCILICLISLAIEKLKK